MDRPEADLIEQPFAPALEESIPREPVEVRGPALRRALALVTTSWIFGSVWGTAVAGAPITLLATNLGASNFHFGLLAALPYVASLVSMPASLVTERTGKRKRIFFWGLYINRLLWIPIAILPLWLVRSYGTAGCQPALIVFLALIFIMQCGGTFGSIAWTSWMADVCPERKRGKYFARRRQWGLITAIPTAFLVGWLLDRAQKSSSGPAPSLPILTWCAIIFLAATVFGLTEIALFHGVPDVPRKPRRGPSLFHAFGKPLRDKQFLWFAGFIATLVFAVTFMGQFATLYLIERVKIKNVQVQLMLLSAPMLAQLLFLPIWGAAADRMGKKPILVLSALGLAPVGIAWCFVTADAIWFGYLVSIFGAVLWLGVDAANLNLVLEMSGSADERDGEEQGGSAYIAVNSVIINIAGCVGGLASGAIAYWLKDWSWHPFPGGRAMTFFEVLFILSGLLRLLAVVIFLPHVREPKAAPTRETLRFMAANLYNNLFNALLLPLRVASRLREATYVERESE